MTVELGDGVLGLEALHTWQASEWYALTIGDLAANPRYKIDRISGLHSLPEGDDSRGNRTGQIGEVAYPSDIHGKTVVYEGRIQAKTLKALREATMDMRSAFSRRVTEGRMDVAPLDAYGTVDHYFHARAIQLDIDEEQLTGPRNLWPFQRRFILGLRMSDPRFYAPTLITDSGKPLGLTVTSYQNDGNAPTDPVFTIEGPVFGNIIIERTSPNPKQLRFTSLGEGEIPAGETVTVDFATRTATVTNGLVLMGHYDFALSDWWDPQEEGLMPGAQNIRVQASGTGTWGISYTSANW
jgi:hypothetical protein